VVYDHQNQLKKAFTDFSGAIDLDPRFALAWYNRGVVYNKLGQPTKAVEDYTKAIELDPKHVPTLNNRGLAYSKLGQTDKAIADLTEAIKLDDKHVSAWSGRGWVYHKRGQWENAVADFSRAIELGTNYPELVLVYRLRAQDHSRLGHFEKARADYQAALKRDPAHARTNAALAWLLATCPDAKLRDPRQAVGLAEKATRRAPNEADCWRALGVAHCRAGNWKEAVGPLDKSVQLRRGGDGVSWLFLAMAHQKLGNSGEARKVYEKAIQWQEQNHEALAKDKEQAEELRRFREEAKEVLELTKS
jgi:tetratricopeptide (TPR) repeat protein